MTEQIITKTTVYKPGMLVKVHQKIKEMNTKGEEKDRIQVFEGTIIAAKHGQEAGATITVRKTSNGVGVEKIYPIHSPIIDKIEVVKEYAVRRAKLSFLRDGKTKRGLEEKKK
ncbi:MAG: 50S ribosomal protein L19 [Candidatus Magasanikbacteria bacterium]|nr:50S ribosomal protein L19 [Candidatus Magasanikbacteria bacterium]